MAKSKICSKCKIRKKVRYIALNKSNKDGLGSWCKKCLRYGRLTWYQTNKKRILQHLKNKRHTNPEYYLWKSARDRSLQNNLEFNIEVTDIKIPKYCPILGWKLTLNDGTLKGNSPTLDRINNELGYVKGNIAVISHKANGMKNGLTLKLIYKIIKYIEKYSKENKNEK